MANNEVTYLEGLIRDFPPPNPPPASEAIVTLGTRYTQLEASVESFADIFAKGPNALTVVFSESTRLIHQYLFQDIVSNAGSYRQEADPNGGFVGFGKDKSRNPHQMEFAGLSPNLIEPKLRAVFASMSLTNPNPVRQGIWFYQQFVFIHPFYDANGRIARFLVSVYMHCYGKIVDWKSLEEKRKSKFIKKLNGCHNHYSHDYEKYLGYLIDFWGDYLSPIPSEEMEAGK